MTTATTIVAQRIERVPARWLVLVLLALHIGLHLPWIDLPVGGYHAWRQIQGASVARNYADENLNFFLPRVDSRGPYSGITGLEFPVIYWSIGLGYVALGQHDWVHRAAMLAWSAPAVCGAFLFSVALFGTRLAGLVGGAMLVFSPLFLYYSFTILPDAPMVGFVLLSLAGLIRSARTGSVVVLASALGSLAFAALLKLTAAAAAPAALLLLARGWPRFGRAERRAAVLVSAAGLAAVAGWYLWARHLSAEYHNVDFLLSLRLPQSPEEVWRPVRKVFLQWLPEVYLSYPEFGFFALGFVAMSTMAPAGLGPLLGALVLGLVLVMAAFVPMLDIHDYYMLPVLPLLLPIATLGALWALRAAERSRAWAVVVVGLAAATAIVGPYRGLSRFHRTRVHPDLATLSRALDDAGFARGDRVIVADDFSPCIYLYWAGRKGWSARRDVPVERWRQMADDGARWLVSDSRPLEERPEIRAWLEPAASHGKFRVYRIVRPDSSRVDLRRNDSPRLGRLRLPRGEKLWGTSFSESRAARECRRTSPPDQLSFVDTDAGGSGTIR